VSISRDLGSALHLPDRAEELLSIQLEPAAALDMSRRLPYAKDSSEGLGDSSRASKLFVTKYYQSLVPKPGKA